MIAIIILSVIVLTFLLTWWWDSATQTVSEQLRERVQSLTPKAVDHAPAFRTWVETRLDDHPDLKAWLLGLSEDGFGALTLRVTAFTSDLNIEMSWLLDGSITVTPELDASCKAVIVNYLEVCRQGIAQQGDITVFDTYHKLVNLNADNRYLNLRRAVFARLSNEGLVDSIPTYDMIMASETQRQEMASDAIKAYATKNWPHFTRILGESARQQANTEASSK